MAYENLNWDWSGGDIEPYQLPKGSTSVSLADSTSSFLTKLGSGISGGLASTGAGVLSGLASANPYAMGAKVIGDVAQAALGGPTNQTAGGKGGFGGGLKLGGGDFIVNYSGKQSTSHSNPDTFSGGTDGGGGPNYWLWGGAALVALIALKMVSR
jgi:hypothetical protein